MADDKTVAPKVPRKRSVKSRTRSGCATCKYESCQYRCVNRAPRLTQRNRVRHVKCDETKPTCNRCLQFKYKCEGYGYGPSGPGLPTTGRSSEVPPVPISRVQTQPKTRLDLRPSSTTSARSSQGRDLPISMIQARAQMHLDNGRPSLAVASIDIGENLDPPSTSVTDDFKMLAEQHGKGQNLDLTHLTMESAISPRLPPTSDEYIEKAFKFTVQIALPGLLLDHTSDSENPSCHTWIRLAAENPAALQVRLYSAELYHRVLFKRPLNPATNLLATYAEAIKLLNEQLRDKETACSDGNLLAVGGLGFFGQCLPKLQSADSLPNQGPLQDLQRLHVYSQLVYDPMHRRGMDLLIKLRGGLDKFKAHGIAAVTSFGDIVNSTENLLQPRHVFAAMLDVPGMAEIQQLGSRIGAHPSLRNLGSGFPRAWQESIITSLGELSKVLQSIAAYTIIVHNHTQEIAVQDNKGKLADMRNFDVEHFPRRTNSWLYLTRYTRRRGSLH